MRTLRCRSSSQCFAWRHSSVPGSQTPPVASAELLASIAALAGEADRTGRVPEASLRAAQIEGLPGLTVPRRLGGQEDGLRTAAQVARAIGRSCTSTGLILAMQFLHQAAIARSARWPEQLAERVGRDAVERGALINTLRVEPALGTPARGGLPATVARRTPDGWRLDGHKIYATGMPALSWLLVWARTDHPSAPDVGYFLVPAGANGVRLVETWDHLGLRASGSHDVIFTDVAIPAQHAVDLRPPTSWGARDAAEAAWNVALIGAVYTGVAEAARDWLRNFLLTRTPSNLGAPLATLPRMQEALGRIEALLVGNRRLLSGLAEDVDAGRELVTSDVNLLKVVLAENAVSAVQQAVELSGNHGLSRQNPLERHLRDVLCVRVHTPQADSAFLEAGKAALKPISGPIPG